MKLNIRSITLSCLFFLASFHADASREDILKDIILDNGFTPSNELYKNNDVELYDEGKVFFESANLSLNGQIACVTCHIPQNGSSDGIPNAAGIRGNGEGIDRLKSGAAIVPRNTLALWGVGSKGFNVLFWDGKLNFKNGTTVSQFGSTAPSADPLVTAVHLPAVEIRETLEEDAFVIEHKNESVKGVNVIYSAIMKNLISAEPYAVNSLSKKLGVQEGDLKFIHVARALAAFIRDEFKIRKTKLEKFVFDGEDLGKEELYGAEIFYGKGGCAVCHSGPNFTDMMFHTVPFPQLGFGKNGFGVDYGRYNATFNPDDLYKFRTPSLFNISRTAPYGHSGSVSSLREAIIAHFDPLRLAQIDKYTSLQRHEFSKVMTYSDVSSVVNYLTEEEIDNLTAFLRTLSF